MLTPKELSGDKDPMVMDRGGIVDASHHFKEAVEKSKPVAQTSNMRMVSVHREKTRKLALHHAESTIPFVRTRLFRAQAGARVFACACPCARVRVE